MARKGLHKVSKYSKGDAIPAITSKIHVRTQPIAHFITFVSDKEFPTLKYLRRKVRWRKNIAKDRK